MRVWLKMVETSSLSDREADDQYKNLSLAVSISGSKLMYMGAKNSMEELREAFKNR